MAVNDDERVSIPIKMGELADLGIKSTKSFIEAGENFLDGNFEEIETLEEENKEPPKTSVKPVSKANPKSTPQQKTTVIETPSREISEEDAFNLLDGKTDDDEIEEELDDQGKPIVKDKTPKGADKKEDAIVLKKLPEKIVTTPETATTEDNDDPEALYTGIAEELIKQGIFAPELDDDNNEVVPVVKDAQEFLQLLTQNANRVAGETIERFLDSKGPEAREIFQSIIVDGVDPREYINRYAAIQDYKTLDLTDELNQEKVVRELYRQAGFETEQIDRKIKQHKEYNDLATEAEQAQKVVVKKEEENIRLLADKKVREDNEKLKVDQEFSSNVARILNEKARAQEFDGIPLNAEEARAVHVDLTVKKYKLENGQLLTEFEKDILELNRPANHALKVKLALLLRTIKKDPTLKTLGKKAVSKEASTLFQGLKKKQAKTGTVVTKTKAEGTAAEEGDDSQPKSWFN